MSFATIYSRAIIGVDAPQVKIEVHLSNGLPAFQIVGLPDTSVRESRDRVRSAILNSKLQFPQIRLTVNLSPADIPKEGARYDQAIAIGILAASKQLPPNKLEEYEFLGELGLNGEIKPTRAAIPSAIAINNANRTAILSSSDAEQTNVIQGSSVLASKNLLEVFHFLSGRHSLKQVVPIELDSRSEANKDINCLSEVIGQEQGKRALEIAAAGQHNILLLGSPGTGKIHACFKINNNIA